MGRFNDPTIYPLVYPPDQANPALLVYVTKGMERSTTEDWKPGLKQAVRRQKEMQRTRPNHPAYIIFTFLFCHTFLVKYAN